MNYSPLDYDEWIASTFFLVRRLLREKAICHRLERRISQEIAVRLAVVKTEELIKQFVSIDILIMFARELIWMATRLEVRIDRQVWPIVIGTTRLWKLGGKCVTLLRWF